MVPSPPVPALVSLPPGLPPHELLLRQASVRRRGRAHTELAAGKELTLMGLPNEDTWLPEPPAVPAMSFWTSPWLAK